MNSTWDVGDPISSGPPVHYTIRWYSNTPVLGVLSSLQEVGTMYSISIYCILSPAMLALTHMHICIEDATMRRCDDATDQSTTGSSVDPLD